MSYSEIKALAEKQDKLIADARAINSAVKSENRDLNAEEREKIDRIMSDESAVEKQITELRNAYLNRVETVRTKIVGEAVQQAVKDGGLRSFVISGDRATLQTTEGSGVVVPDAQNKEFVEILANMTGVRQAGARVFKTAMGGSFPVMVKNDTAAAGRVVAEAAQNATVTNQVITGKTLSDYNYTSDWTEYSEQLLNDSPFPFEEMIQQDLADRISRNTNNAYINGNGSSTAKGILDVTYGASIIYTSGGYGDVAFEELQAWEASLNHKYRSKASILCHDTWLSKVKLLADLNGTPLWRRDLSGVAPTKILGYDYFVSDEMPTQAASSKSAVLGDFSKYWIRDVGNLVLKRDPYRKIEFSTISFFAYLRSDGILTDQSAMSIYRNGSTT